MPVVLRTKSAAAAALVLTLAGSTRAAAQATSPAPAQDPHAAHTSTSASPWMWMTDGAAFITFNEQGSDRGERQVRSQNWFMVMGSRALGPGRLTLNGMFSAEPLTVTKRGYSELFQHGEAYNGLENIDRQHPHDLFMQLAAVWQVPLGRYRLSLAGAPVGEATLGPVAFMHRVSAFENPTSPLSHHTLDSTHMVQGLVAAGVDRGPVTVEASWFRGREPDQDRVDLNFGALDSWAARVWFRPWAGWTMQASYGFLKEPEELEPGDVRRSTASISWQRGDETNLIAVSTMVGQNRRTFTTLTAFNNEVTVRRNRLFAYGRYERLQVGTEHLLFPTVVHRPHALELIDIVSAYTAGGGVHLGSIRGFQLAAAADVTFYTVPNRLVPHYGTRPVSSHVFLRIRPPVGHMGRMWDMTMIPR